MSQGLGAFFGGAGLPAAFGGEEGRGFGQGGIVGLFLEQGHRFVGEPQQVHEPDGLDQRLGLLDRHSPSAADERNGLVVLRGRAGDAGLEEDHVGIVGATGGEIVGVGLAGLDRAVLEAHEVQDEAVGPDVVGVGGGEPLRRGEGLVEFSGGLEGADPGLEGEAVGGIDGEEFVGGLDGFADEAGEGVEFEEEFEGALVAWEGVLGGLGKGDGAEDVAAVLFTDSATGVGQGVEDFAVGAVAAGGIGEVAEHLLVELPGLMGGEASGARLGDAASARPPGSRIAVLARSWRLQSHPESLFVIFPRRPPGAISRGIRS